MLPLHHHFDALLLCLLILSCDGTMNIIRRAAPARPYKFPDMSKPDFCVRSFGVLFSNLVTFVV